MSSKSSKIPEINELDRKILRILSLDSRKSYRTISREVGTTTATVIKRVKNLEKLGVIGHYGVNMDYEKLGYDLTALIELIIARGKLVEVEKEISRIPNVFAVYDVTGDYDAVVLARFKSRRELNTMVKSLLKIENVERTNTHLVLNVMKQGSSLV